MSKKNNRIMIISICICAFIVVALILVLAFMDPIVGNVKLRQIRSAAEDCGEIVITDPLYEDSFSRGAEAVLEGNEARALADSFLDATKDTSYKKVIDGSKGFWDTRIDFCVGDEKHTVYLREDTTYVANNGYLFEIGDASAEKYREFYDKVTDILDGTKE